MDGTSSTVKWKTGRLLPQIKPTIHLIFEQLINIFTSESPPGILHMYRLHVEWNNPKNFQEKLYKIPLNFAESGSGTEVLMV